MLIYLAGPLFSAAEREFNLRLTEKLEASGYRVFLPQRDGVDGKQPPHPAMTPDERRAAIFSLDTAKIMECDVFLFVLDGRVPDEGACVELGIAYCQKQLQQPHKRLIGLHTDKRAAFIGAKLNPMVRMPLEYVADTAASYIGLVSTNQHTEREH
jgi:nucleoside 2-deoxyribosyltransferase